MVSTPSGMITSLNFVQLLNASSATVTTFSVFPSIVTSLGIVTAP